MNLLILIPVLGVMLVLWFMRASTLIWLLAWWLGFYALLRFGFEVPIPASVLSIYMGITTLALIAYVSSDRKRFEDFYQPLLRFATDRRYALPLTLLLILAPALAAGKVYLDMSVPVAAPSFARTIHPAPPDEITVHDNKVDLIKVENPYRHLEATDPEQFRAHVENGRQVYYRNCFYCHGDVMAGDGMYARGLDPIPTNFTDPGTIAMLQESFLFWRIAKGGPGLPDEGGPWMSPMPAWEKFLTEQEIWEVILFMYDFTEQKPRAREEHH